MTPSVRDRIAIGFRLSQASLAAWGTDRFWSYLSWWHEEIHYTIPQEKLAKEMENLFCKTTPVLNFSGSLGLGTVTPNIGLDLVATGSSSLLITAPDAVGTWKFEGLSIQTTKRPHLLRRGVMWLVMGARWKGNKSAEALPIEYERLKRIFSLDIL
jgi:hypothetical protein